MHDDLKKLWVYQDGGQFYWTLYEGDSPFEGAQEREVFSVGVVKDFDVISADAARDAFTSEFVRRFPHRLIVWE